MTEGDKNSTNIDGSQSSSTDSVSKNQNTNPGAWVENSTDKNKRTAGSTAAVIIVIVLAIALCIAAVGVKAAANGNESQGISIQSGYVQVEVNSTRTLFSANYTIYIDGEEKDHIKLGPGGKYINTFKIPLPLAKSSKTITVNVQSSGTGGSQSDTKAITVHANNTVKVILQA
jgi:flagellar basal body-associated protein FliL